MKENIFKEAEQLRLIDEHKTQKEIRYLQVLWCKCEDREHAAHEMKVHPGLVPKEREASSLDAREIAINSDEISALCREPSKLLHGGLATEAIKKYE